MLATRKGALREEGSEGSVVQNRDPTNRNRIRGSSGRTSARLGAKSISITTLGCRSGGDAAKATGLTPGDLHGCLERRLRNSQGDPNAMQESAEGIVGGNEPAPRRDKVWGTAGGLTDPKARTVPEQLIASGK